MLLFDLLVVYRTPKESFSRCISEDDGQLATFKRAFVFGSLILLIYVVPIAVGVSLVSILVSQAL